MVRQSDKRHLHSVFNFLTLNRPLDPAKMNRAVHLYRPSPSDEDLKRTAKGMVTNEKLRRKVGIIASACNKVPRHFVGGGSVNPSIKNILGIQRATNRGLLGFERLLQSREISE